MAASAYTATPHRASLRISTTSEDANWAEPSLPDDTVVQLVMRNRPMMRFLHYHEAIMVKEQPVQEELHAVLTAAQ